MELCTEDIKNSYLKRQTEKQVMMLLKEEGLMSTLGQVNRASRLYNHRDSSTFFQFFLDLKQKLLVSPDSEMALVPKCECQQEEEENDRMTLSVYSDCDLLGDMTI